MNTPVVVRAASVGFTLLLVGELVARSVVAVTGVAGPLLPMASALAYTAAGMRATGGRAPALRPEPAGVLAAVGAYAFTVPLRLMAGAPGITVTVTNLVFAAVVGAAAARIAAAARAIPPNGGSEADSRRPKDPSSALSQRAAVSYRSSRSHRGSRKGGARG
ncbi:MAG: hypothetical protein ACRDY7_15185 [Acidimicrobiia bacterium]